MARGATAAAAVAAVAATALARGAAGLPCEGTCMHAATAPLMARRMAARNAFVADKISGGAAARPTLEREPLEPGTTAPCIDGLADGFYECSGVDLLGELTLADQGSLASLGSDIWGWADPLTGFEYAIMTFMDGTSITNVTDPSNPIPLFFLGTTQPVSHDSYWRDVKVYNTTAYIVVDTVKDHGMQVFDLTRVREASPELVNAEADLVYTGFGEAHNIFVNEETGFAYAVGVDRCLGGIYAMDVATDPLNPTFVGCWSADRYVHDLQCVVYSGPDTEFTGREICFCYNEDSIAIIDITDKNVTGGNSEMTNVQVLANVTYDYEYTHQGWVTDDQSILLLDDEGDIVKQFSATWQFDITSLRAPILIGKTETDIVTIDHNQYIKGDFTYQSNYASGLRIKSIAPVYEGKPLEEVAFFDAFPGDTGEETTWDGVWSSYIYLPSGNLLVGSQEYGLLVVREQPREEEEEEEEKPLTPVGKFGLVMLVMGVVCAVMLMSRKSSREPAPTPETQELSP